MQICASTDNLSAPVRSDHALHGIPPRRDLSSRGRFVCALSWPGLAGHGKARRGEAGQGKATLSHSYQFSGPGKARRGRARLGLAGQGEAGHGDVIALIPVFRAGPG